MMIVKRLDLPTVAGVHQVIMDRASAEMLAGLAAAWNQRQVVAQVRRIAGDQDRPEIRKYVERDLRLALQQELAERSLTALWRTSPAWYRLPRPPEVSAFLDQGYDPDPAMWLDWCCEVKALCLPTSAWDGASWAP